MYILASRDIGERYNFSAHRICKDLLKLPAPHQANKGREPNCKTKICKGSSV
jgi:hypothetical protein